MRRFLQGLSVPVLLMVPVGLVIAWQDGSPSGPAEAVFFGHVVLALLAFLTGCATVIVLMIGKKNPEAGVGLMVSAVWILLLGAGVCMWLRPGVY